MKIFCVINNYGEDNSGVKSEEADWYMVPDSGILKHDNPMYIPDFDKEFRGYLSLIVKICKLGKTVSARFANRYYTEVAPGVAMQASGLLQELKEGCKPWTRAVVFDKCCLVGDFIPTEEWGVSGSFEVRCGDKTICWDQDKMLKSIDELIELISRNNIIKIGDMILVGLSQDYIVPERDKTLSAYIGDKEKLQIRFK